MGTVSDHYLISVAESGVVTLIPASVRPAILDRLEEIAPDFAAQLEAATADGSHPSDLWKDLDQKARG